MKDIPLTELRMMVDMLGLAYDTYSNHGCNDYTIPVTPDNVAFAKRLESYLKEDDIDIDIIIDGQKIWLTDTSIMEYCKHVLQEHIKYREEH